MIALILGSIETKIWKNDYRHWVFLRRKVGQWILSVEIKSLPIVGIYIHQSLGKEHKTQILFTT